MTPARAIDVQRRRDGAFFEDWSEWWDLGGRPQYNSYPVGRRPTNLPRYHCTLRGHSTLVDGPGFEVAIPQDIRVARLLKAIAGARQYPRHRLREGPIEIWLVPAESWVELRRSLPEIKRIITAKFGNDA